MIAKKTTRRVVTKRPATKKVVARRPAVAKKPVKRVMPRRMHGDKTLVYNVDPYANNVLKAIEYTKQALSDNYLANIIKNLDQDVSKAATNEQIISVCRKYLKEIKLKNDMESKVAKAYQRALQDGYEEKYTLVGQDGNAFSLMGYVANALKREGLRDYIDEMHKEATKSDYDGLLRVMIKYIDYANMKHFEKNDY